MKRLFDIALSAGALILAAPVLCGLAIVIKATSPGPIFYRGLRVGRHGQLFRIFKFRSMVANAEKIGGSSTADGDIRITTVGRFMRKWKLDELPQLLNVVVGEMSFVGPRPEIEEYTDLYTEQEKPILTMRPGITDWASIWNSDEGAVLAGWENPDQAYLEIIRPTKLKLQLIYARKHSLWIDLRILVYTVRKIFVKEWLPTELEPFGNVLAQGNGIPRKQKAA